MTSNAQLLAEATRGINCLLDDDLPGAKKVLASRPESPWHLVGLGLISFLVSALGMEDAELSSALDTLFKAEAAATKGKASAGATQVGYWWPKGTEFDVVATDAVMAQALVHVRLRLRKLKSSLKYAQILTESYLEFMKAVYKLNRAYKQFTATFKLVFPNGVKDTDTVEDIINGLNALHRQSQLMPPPSATHRSWGSLLKGKSDPKSSSHLDLSSTLNKKKSSSSLERVISKTAPTTPQSTTPTEEKHAEEAELTAQVAEKLKLVERVRPSWEGDEIAQLVVGGSAFGHGLFELVFALLPPKLRKTASWFGYSTGNRATALKLLSVAAMGTDVHASFAALCLLTYYGLVLLMSGWQADRSIIIEQCRQVLERVHHRLPNGTLWLLNEAKVTRMSGDVDKAMRILKDALARSECSFRQAETVLQFELGWCQLSVCDYRAAYKSFVKMRELNQWSHATYTIIAIGAVCDVHDKNAEERELVDKLLTTELPAMLGKKRVMGAPPPSEAFVSARIDGWTKKRDRWSAAGRLGHNGQTLRPYEVIRLSPAHELGLHWQTFARMPPQHADFLVKRLSSFTPAPAPTLAALKATTTAPVDLDTKEELALRATLLGVLYRRTGDFDAGAAYLLAVINLGFLSLDESHSYLVAVAYFESAVLECHRAEKEVEGTRDPSEAKQVWARRLKLAERHLDEIFKLGTFLMQSRTESRSQMLRTEIASKRASLSL